ncbi:myb-like DNA-binding protein FlbD [Capronia epimyces CBS 606.96]|uniref:Myb-like DNA-binding protein FlbD n=1 Tax=Capronia epimyces CBS 606.96 TaxID=1182542 RepID=W9ZE15_9EURO|nr:myb-like DNA-binding protein FlbD [Capronia epimyces CBS 606.96]EXJ92769.1 myb-like DNA-binding protein FlbD [Capronia epimyces CBS 606.96]
MSRTSRRGPWLPEEDAALLHLVHTQGPNNWVRISQHMQHRSPKQCRERYHQNLKPSLNHEPISADEGEMIEHLVQDMGKRWAEIARRLGNRSDNAVKNWWNGSMNRRKRTDLQQGGGSRMVGYRPLPIPASASAHQLYLHELPMPLQHTTGYPSPQPLSFGRREVQHTSYSFADTRPFDSEHNEATRSQPGRNTSLGQTLFKSASYSSFDHIHNSTSQSRPTRLSPCPPVEPVVSERPFPPRSRSADRAQWQLPPFYSLKAPAYSPAPTESSHASLNQRAPSLVSDSPSNCSISPRSVSSPRQGISTSEEATVQMWPELLPSNPVGTRQNERLGARDEISKQRPSNLPTRPALPHSLTLPEALAFSPRSTGLENPLPESPDRERSAGKDTRMNVSRLLG